MDSEPLLSPTSQFFKNQHFPSSSSSPISSSPLCPLPEHQEITIPPDTTTSFSPFSPSAHADPTWLLSKPNLHRSRTAPAISSILLPDHHHHDITTSLTRPSIVRTSFLLLLLYLSLGITIYSLFASHFNPNVTTHPVIDALYFCIVTMCTIGYGDITPTTPFAKLFSVLFVLFGFGFIDILLSSMVTYVLDLQESLLLASLGKTITTKTTTTNRKTNSYLIDVKKGRMRIRMKVGLALLVVVLCIGVGTGMLRFVEKMGWVDSFYLAVMSVTTVGYGDRAFKTMFGRLFASIWLLVSTLAVARAFLYLAEARIDKRHRKIAKWVLSRDMTVSEFLAADIDNNGF